MRITASYYNEVFVEWVIARKIMLTHHKEAPVITTKYFLAQFSRFQHPLTQPRLPRQPPTNFEW